MHRVSRSAFVVLLFGALSIAKLAQAGDVQGKIKATGLKSVGGIAIYIDAIPGKKFDRPADHVSVDQKNMLFVPRTVVILRGTTVDFLNSDQVLDINLIIQNQLDIHRFKLKINLRIQKLLDRPA